MRYLTSESTYILANYDTGDTVTIDVIRLNDDTQVVTDASMSEVGSSGVFKYLFSQSVSAKTEYLYIITNSTEKHTGKIILGGYPDDIKDETDKIQTVDTNVDSVLADTNELQGNQGDWATATGQNIENAVWNADHHDHNNSDSFGEKNQRRTPSETVSDYWATGFAVPNEYDTELANIQTEVNGLNGEAMRGTNNANTIIPASRAEATSDKNEVIAEVDANEVKIDAIQTDLDNPDQFKATGFAVSNEYDTELANIQAEVNGLNGDAMRGTNSVPTNPLLTNDARLNHLDGDITAVPSAVLDEIA